jgi:pimeloyl-ACP methyl ester carboxylesterase
VTRPSPIKATRRAGELVAGNAAKLGIAAGIAGLGAAVGLAVDRYAAGRSFRRVDTMRDEPFGQLRGIPMSVHTDDGVRLNVEVHEPTEPAQPDGGGLTILFVHGFTLHQDSWHFQRRDLRDLGRLVCYDIRSHGRSGPGPRENATVEQLAHDLMRVLDAAAPTGPIVLVGHSLGGMVVMGLADGFPELFGDRIVGVALIATSPGRMAEVMFGFPSAIMRHVRPHVHGIFHQLAKRAETVEYGRQIGKDLTYVVTKRLSFGPNNAVPPSLVAFSRDLIASTGIDVIADYFPVFDSHDKLAALPVLRACETLVIGAENDMLTPVSHSREIAEALPDAEFMLLDDCGHMIQLEYPDEVNDAIRRLVARVMIRMERGRGGPLRALRWRGRGAGTEAS